MMFYFQIISLSKYKSYISETYLFSILGKNYPKTKEDDPLILIYKNNNTATSFSISLSPELDIPKFPVFPNLVSVEHDASQAKVSYFC